MSTSPFQISKYLDTLPSVLTPDTVYAVKTGEGFDLYISDKTGTVAEKINSADKTFNHNQNISSNEWVINHNLNKYPSIICLDSTGDEVTGDVEYSTLNMVTVRFTSAFGGTAKLN